MYNSRSKTIIKYNNELAATCNVVHMPRDAQRSLDPVSGVEFRVKWRRVDFLKTPFDINIVIDIYGNNNSRPHNTYHESWYRRPCSTYSTENIFIYFKIVWNVYIVQNEAIQCYMTNPYAKTTLFRSHHIFYIFL